MKPIYIAGTVSKLLKTLLNAHFSDDEIKDRWMHDCYKNQSLNKVQLLLNIPKSSTVPIVSTQKLGR